MDAETLNVVAEVGKAVAKDAYTDVAHDALASTGSVLGLIPKALNAALVPVREWIERKEYNFEKTRRLLEMRLANVKPDDIVLAEAHIAVPVIQAIAYSMDNEMIRGMYANLLASSMTNTMKSNVHPAFAEFIKQLSPDDARVLKYVFSRKDGVPMLTLVSQNQAGEGYDVVSNFTTLYRDVPGLEWRHPDKTAVSVDNLARLQLIVKREDQRYTDKSLYDALYEDSALFAVKRDYRHREGYAWVRQESYFEITALGKSFCTVCL